MRLFLIAALLVLGGFAPLAPRAEAVFAMGCFWCAEHDMEAIPGVIAAVSGYTGGGSAKTDYEAVSAGGTGHYEAVRVIYDPAKVSYATLLGVFWKNVDPFDAKGQFCDKGSSYRAAIFPVNAVQRAEAEASKAAVEKRFGKPVVTAIIDKTAFHVAEQYHQDYADKNPIRYRFYRTRCGRDSRLKAIWGG